MGENRQATGRGGLAYGLAAYGLWGVIPLYFWVVRDVAPAEILAHRIVWAGLMGEDVPFPANPRPRNLRRHRGRLLRAVKGLRSLDRNRRDDLSYRGSPGICARKHRINPELKQHL